MTKEEMWKLAIEITGTQKDNLAKYDVIVLERPDELEEVVLAIIAAMKDKA